MLDKNTAPHTPTPSVNASANSAAPDSKKKNGIAIDVPSVTLPKGGGAIKGIDEQFKMNPSNGTSSFSVKVPLSAGRNGYTPSLALNYNSGSGNSIAGIGWSLDGTSIQRRTDRRLPRYNDADDTFMFSGAEELVPALRWQGGHWVPDADTIAGFQVQVYRPRLESNVARIERIRQGNDTWWRTISKDNHITYFGTSPASRLHDPADPSRVFQWLPDFSLDDRGNCIAFTYKPENLQGVPNTIAERNRLNGNALQRNLYLKSIRYGNATPCYRDAVHAMLPPNYVGAYRFEAVLDYGEHHATLPTPAEVPGQDWALRPDPFSTYRPGFEVRSYRLLQRVLMFHTFPDLQAGQPCLVRSLDLGYTSSGVGAGQDAELSYLSSVTQNGYHSMSNGQYSKKSLPALEFSYQPLDWDNTIHTLDKASQENLPSGIDGPYQWVDLWGEGIPGILSEQANGWFYKRNAGDRNEDGQIHLDHQTLVAPRPSFSGFVSGGALSLQDLENNGQKQIVVHDKSLQGYFELSDDLQWLPFQAFPQILNAKRENAHQKMLDLNGDGKADILISEENAFVWHEALGKQGYGSAQRSPKAGNEEHGPALVFSDESQSVFLADMCGDGLQDIVRVRNGEVSYWPNLGYGRFGARVAMANAPWFTHPDLFDPGQLKLADLSGTGNVDLLYLTHGGCKAWLNLSGNAWSEAQDIVPFLSTARPNTVSVSDILGNGTACIVWTSSLPEHAQAPLRYIDLMAGKKPHLLTRYVNNLGKETRLSYKSSTWFYNNDRALGQPWITRLPFPVHCMRKTEMLDHVEGSRYVSEYSYHHGYYDHREREFRGFGRVDQLDTEEFEHWVKSGATNVVDATLHQAPVLTKTWYHLGAGMDRQRLLSQFATEYWPEEINRKGFPVVVNEPKLDEARLIVAPHLPLGAIAGFNDDEWQEAMRACKGMPLRAEVFALDAPSLNATDQERKRQLSPYSVATHNCVVALIQPKGAQQHAVFVVNESETLTLNYDRNITDPRISHTLNVRVDELGNVLESASVVYGRQVPGVGLPIQTSAAQSLTQVSYQKSSYTDDSISPTTYRLRLLAEQSSYEIKGLIPSGGLFKIIDFDRPTFHVLLNSTPVEYHQYQTVPPLGTVHRRLLSQERSYYLSADLVTPLALHEIHPLGLVAEKYKLAFSSALLADIFGIKATAPMMAEGEYMHLDGDTNWWIRSGTTQYLHLGEAPTAAATRFYSALSVTDPLGAKTSLSYFSTDFLLMQETVDAALNHNTVLAFDLRTLQARRTRDANLNITEVIFDELGRVKVMARLGKGLQADDLTGHLDWEDAAETLNLQHFAAAATPSALALAAQPLLQKATLRFAYDWDRYKSSGGSLPALSATIAREEYFQQNVDSPLQLKFEYANGSGKVTMTKAQAEPGLAKQVIENPNASIQILTVDTSAGPNPQNRWIGNGRKVLNNKGNVVKEYEPYFSVTHQYENHKELVETGKGSITYYDALGRPIKVMHPDGTLTKVVFDSWKKEAWDRNDTCAESPWYLDRIHHNIDAALLAAGKDPMREAEAAAQAFAHAGTQFTEHFDAQGRSVLQVTHNGKDNLNVDIQYNTYLTLDIQGQAHITTDTLLRPVLTSKYDMLGNALYQVTPDSGARWKLMNIFGEAMYDWDNRQHVFHTQYNDPIHRITQKTVSGGDGAPLNHVIERIVYGEGALNDQALNLRGQAIVLYDTAGKLESLAFDLDGKLVSASRRFATDYKSVIDWPALNPDALLDPEAFPQTFEYDAMGRVKQQTSADGSTYLPTYNAANLLQAVQVQRLGLTETFVHNIDYSEKGQRTKIRFGNDVTADYFYDNETWRITRLHSYRLNGESLQDLYYTYDAVGNLTHLEDKCIPVRFWDNQKTTGLSTYTYDPIYQLVHATGREHAATVNLSSLDNWNDLPFLKQLNPNDDFLWRPYAQVYRYDEVGNLSQLIHTADMAGYTRNYSYVPGTNRLDFTSISGQNYHYHPHPQHGFATAMPHLTRMQWNYRDQLQAVATQAVNAGEPETTWYVYDSKGERVRKVTDKAHAQGAQALKKEQRYYLGTVELYRSYDNAGDLDVERYTLHVSDDKQRIAMVDNRTVGQNGQPDAHLVRYQLPNHLSSASMEVDQTGRVISYEEHHPFGTTSYQARNATVNAAAKRYRFTGMERDEESGLEYHSARYYVPWLGRWLSPDKLGEKQKGNRYAYVNNNPLKFMDTNGMFEEPAHGALTYRLALAAGFTREDAAQIALATAGMDHDKQDRPGDGIGEMMSQIEIGRTQQNHYPSQEDSLARVNRDVANLSPQNRDNRDLVQLGRDLHSLEDTGTRENPGPHNRNPSGGAPIRDLTPTLIGVGIVSLEIAAVLTFFALREGNGNPGLMAGLLFAASIFVMFALKAIIFGVQAVGTGHPTYRTERGAQSNFASHVADQVYQDPRANRAEFNQIFSILQRAAAAKYGTALPMIPQNVAERLRDEAITGAVEAQTMESIDAYMHQRPTMPDGSQAPSYVEILPTRTTGAAWRPEDMDITVEGDDRSYRDFYNKAHPNPR